MTESLRIVVLDDDPVMRELLDALLSLGGHNVECFESCEACLDRMRHAPTQPIDVLLTDLHMPGLQGEALLAKLREHRPAGAVLLGMSGSPASDAELALVDAFLLKPFTPDDFEAACKHAGQAATAQPAVAGPPTTDVLDATVFDRLRSALPTAQLHALFQLALDDIAHREDRMRAAAATGDTATLRSEAHAIKGGAGMIGAIEVQGLAARLEGGEYGVTPEDFALGRARLRRMLDELLPT